MKKFKKADYILFAVVMIIAAAFIIMLKINNKTNLYVYVQIGNEKKYYYNLASELDEKFEMYDDNGNKCYNELIIHDGFAYVNTADCFNQICVNSNQISKNGESIVCLPHKFSVTIVSADTNLK